MSRMIHVKTFDELTTSELYEIIKLRIVVFVVEQNCPYPETDDLDQVAHHVLYYKGEELIAYSRILPDDTKYDVPSIGRIVVKKAFRGTEVGAILIKKSIEAVYERFGKTTIKIAAQQPLKAYYEQFGFRQISEMYLEDDIPHVDMSRSA